MIATAWALGVLLLAAVPALSIQLQQTGGGCHTAEKGEKCYEEVVWAMWRGIMHQPERYPGLTGLSAFEEFQAALHSDPSTGCARPCPARGPAPDPAPARGPAPLGRLAALADRQCGAPLGADACYAKVHSAIRYDLVRHPELYPTLTEDSDLGDVRTALRGWSELAELCRRPCGGAQEPRSGAELMPAAMQLVRKDCHTAIEGEACHKEVRWAMRSGILERPEWYPGLSINSSFEDFQSFLHGQNSHSHVCKKPCKAQRAAAHLCHTAEPGEDCHKEVTWAMTKGISERPRWYPNLTMDSSFEDFQAFLHGLDVWSQTCPEPCDAPKRTQQVCHTAVEGEACHQQVRWAMQHGIMESPGWYPSLTVDSPFEDFQALLHGMDAWSKICPKPCGAPKRHESTQQVCHTVVEGEACHQQVRWAMQHGILEHPGWYPNLTADSSFEDFQALLHGMDAWSKICPKPCVLQRASAARRKLPSYRPIANTQESAVQSQGRTPAQGCRTAALGDACYNEVLWMKTEGVLLHPAWFQDLSKDSSLEDFQAFLHGLYPVVLLCPDSPCRAATSTVEATGVAAAAERLRRLQDAAVEAAEAETRASEFAAEAAEVRSPSRRHPAVAELAARGVEGDREGLPPLPNSSGCFVWLPSGCRKQHFRARVRWKRDEWGEANKHSGDSKAACDARKDEFDTWCWVTDAVMLHVPAAGARGVPGDAGARDGRTTWAHSRPVPPGDPRPPAASGAGAEGQPGPPAGAPPLPSSAGCYIWLPSGCRSGFMAEWGERRWSRDEWGEALTPPSGHSGAACMARKGFFDELCGVTDAVNLYVPGGS